MAEDDRRISGSEGPEERWLVPVMILGIFALALISHRIVAVIPGYSGFVRACPEWARRLLQPLRWMILVLVGMAIVGVHPRAWLRELGLAVPPLHAMAAITFALACSAPMLLVGTSAGLEEGVQPARLLYAAAIYPFAEEVLFRGYAFGQLLRRARWGVWGAAIATGAVFGVVHLTNPEVQYHGIAGRLLSVAMIAGGGIAYAWLFYRWRFSLWIAVGLHAFMNLWYAIFDTADTPIGSTWLVAARIAVVGIAIAVTEVLVRLGWAFVGKYREGMPGPIRHERGPGEIADGGEPPPGLSGGRSTRT